MICHDRFWWIQMVAWILASCLVAWVGTEISVPAWFHHAPERTPITPTGTSPNKVGTWIVTNQD
jgi:hypothetical protein